MTTLEDSQKKLSLMSKIIVKTNQQTKILFVFDTLYQRGGGGASERLSRILKPFNIQFSTKPTKNKLGSLKDKRKVEENTNCVY